MTESTDRWTVEIESSICVGSGLCAATAPDCFTLDTAGRAVSAHRIVEPADEILEAAENCPATAISLHSGDGKEIFAA
ncbi:ferredoxin [Streptomyces coerulescens]|uniref:Ferredoxin n=1 Tax=Streptomyces coerulescens TaxID=29304 RepID=A0ABW0CXI2_STRCD